MSGMEADQLRCRPDAGDVTEPRRGWPARLAGRARSSPYYPALSHPVPRRVLPGAAGCRCLGAG
jgi:hypothetical protein